MLKKTLLAVAVLTVLTLAFTSTRGLGGGAGNYKIGDKIADFSFKSDQGKTVKLSDYRGKVVVLNFFATW